ncbi:UNVERIFIED_CONTAM: hypothetical protein Sangu_2730100 [Sesamum angustifolium]|uniref:Reverse transcriptase zinc-binding domain-containing protein n=1 Tax=Sesamum angustifolium TaxID=2727405 RepID=A0AAW2IW26_9LAMI
MLCKILARTEFARGEMPVQNLGIPLVAQRLNFLWNSKRAPVAWEDICHPKNESGLGIRHTQTWNVALLARVLWNIHRKADTFGYSGSMLFISKEDQFGTGNRRRAIHHSFNGLSKSATESLSLLARRRRQSSTWPDGPAVRFLRPKRAKQPWQMVIWKTFIPPKYSFILWLGLRGRLSTRDRLMFLQEDSSCSLCINTQETAKHLFFECPFSDFVWTNIRQWLGISRRMSTLLSA